MRPLIEILEDERTLLHKLETVEHYLLRDDDPEVLSILNAQRNKVIQNLDLLHIELKEYIGDLFS